jgi:hypothetical protein
LADLRFWRGGGDYEEYYPLGGPVAVHTSFKGTYCIHDDKLNLAHLRFSEH